MTNAWRGIEKTSGKHWRELPDDYMVPACPDPCANCIIVTGNGEEQLHWMGGAAGQRRSLQHRRLAVGNSKVMRLRGRPSGPPSG